MPIINAANVRRWQSARRRAVAFGGLILVWFSRAARFLCVLLSGFVRTIARLGKQYPTQVAGITCLAISIGLFYGGWIAESWWFTAPLWFLAVWIGNLANECLNPPIPSRTQDATARSDWALRSHPVVSVSGKGRVDAYWLDTKVTIRSPIKTPLGSKVTVLGVCVDINYAIRNGVITVAKVQLASGASLGSAPVNVASRNGEAFYLRSISPTSALVEAIESDIADPESRLRRIMVRKVSQ